MELHQTKNLCTVKETFNKTKRQSTKWKNTFTNNISNREFISKHIKNSLNSITKKSLKNWQRT